MRTRPNYFKFRQWLNWAMKDNPLGNDHFHANDIYQDNLLDETEVFSSAFILSYGASMLEDAHRYFQKHEYFIKRPIFFCGLDDIKNCDTTYFENDDSIPNFSTLEKTATWFQYDGWNPQIFFYVTLTDVWQNRPYKNYKFISTPAPEWFGTQYRMVYTKALYHNEIWHDLIFYHSDAMDFFPFDKNKWCVCPCPGDLSSVPKSETRGKN